MSFFDYFQYPFVRYALLVGTLVALCAAVLGVSLVLKRFSFIGDGLSHVAFGAMAIAAVLNLAGSDMVIIMPVTVISAVLMLRSGKKVKGDAVIAAVSVGALAVGYLLMNVFSASSNVSGDVCGSLFGATAVLTLTTGEVIVCAIICSLVLAFYCVFYNRIFTVTFDEEFASSAGINVGLFNTFLAAVSAAVIVLAMKLAGSLLTSALIVFPALCAMRVCKSFKSVVLTAAAVSVISTLVGMVLSILLSTPIGATIVAADIVVYAVFCVVGLILKR